jgi:hypothetical protein
MSSCVEDTRPYKKGTSVRPPERSGNPPARRPLQCSDVRSEHQIVVLKLAELGFELVDLA